MIVAVTAVVAIVVMIAAAAGVLALHLKRQAGVLTDAIAGAARQLQPITDELTDELAVFDTESEQLQQSLARLGRSRRS